MRAFTLAACFLAAALSACGPGEVSVSTDQGSKASAAIDLGGKSGGYALHTFVKDGVKTYLVVRPDGMQAAALVDDKGSRVIDAGDAHAAMSDTVSAMPPPGGEKVAIAAPGLSINVQDDKSEPGSSAKVSIQVGDKKINVRANEDSADGKQGDAVVEISGADADSARRFIDKAEGLSADVKTQMKSKLGL